MHKEQKKGDHHRESEREREKMRKMKNCVQTAEIM